MNETDRIANRAMADEILKDPSHYSFDVVIGLLQLASDCYYNDVNSESFMTDEEFDYLQTYCKKLNPVHPFFLQVGADVRGGKVKLPIPMPGLDQIDYGNISAWLNKNKLLNEKFVISEKLDGYSALLVYDHEGNLRIAYSRGNGFEAADITRHLKKMKSVPQRINQANCMIRGEIVLKKNLFDRLHEIFVEKRGSSYKNPRNFVSGQMNSEQSIDEFYDSISFVACGIMGHGHDKLRQIDIMGNACFELPRIKMVNGSLINDDFLIKTLNEWRDQTTYEIDGIVLDVNSKETRKNMKPHENSINPTYTVKYKQASTDNFSETTCVEVEWNTSKDGYQKPRVKVEPVNLLGVTISYCTGFNAKFIRDNGIGPGAKLIITRSGDVIPYIVKVVEKVEPALPTLNDLVWTENEVDLKIKNAESDSTVQFEQLLYFFASMDIPNAKEASVRKLYDDGYTTPESVIVLDETTLMKVVGNAAGSKIYQGLKQKLNPVQEWQLAGSLSVFGRGVGKRLMKKLIEENPDISSLDYDKILMVPGFQEKTAKKIMSGIPAYKEFLQKIKGYYTLETKEPIASNKPLQDKIVAFTGVRDKLLEAKIEKLGGKIGSVTRKTWFLIAKDPNEKSTKLNNARALGIEVISLEEARKRIDSFKF